MSKKTYLVSYDLYASGEVEVEAESAAEARAKVEGGFPTTVDLLEDAANEYVSVRKAEQTEHGRSSA